MKKLFRILKDISFVLLILSLCGLHAEATEYGIAIGVSDYDPLTDASDIPGPHYDAENVSNSWISQGMNPKNITVLVGKNTTTARINAEFEKIARRAKLDDTIRISWSSHGWGGELLTRDGAISREGLQSMLENLSPERIELLVDTCDACNVDIEPIVGKSVYILGSVGKGEIADEVVVESPSGEPEVKGVGSYLYSQAYKKLIPQEDKYPIGDRNQDGKVDIQEAEDFMKKEGELGVISGLDLIRQKACLKERTLPGLEPEPLVGVGERNTWQGKVHFLVRSGQSGDAGDIAAPFFAGAYNLNSSFNGEGEFSLVFKERNEDKIIFVNTRGQFRYNGQASYKGGTKATAYPGSSSQFTMVDGGGYEDWSGSGTIMIPRETIFLEINEKMGYYKFSFNSGDYKMQHTWQHTVSFMGKPSQDSGQEKVEGSCTFDFTGDYKRGQREIKGSRLFTQKDALREAQASLAMLRSPEATSQMEELAKMGVVMQKLPVEELGKQVEDMERIDSQSDWQEMVKSPEWAKKVEKLKKIGSTMAQAVDLEQQEKNIEAAKHKMIDHAKEYPRFPDISGIPFGEDAKIQVGWELLVEK